MKKLLSLFAALCLLVPILYGCAKPAQQNAYSPGELSYSGKLDGLSPSQDAVSANESRPSGESGELLALEGRKLIRDAELSIQTLEFDTLISELNRRTAELGGYVESSSVSGRSYYETGTLRRANVVLRIPAERLDDFLGALNEICNITDSSEKVQDVTSQYVDIEARLASLRTEYDALLDLLSKAESLDNILTLQERLSEVRYKIESYEAQKRSFDGRIAYSTVTLSIREVERETVTEKESFSKEVGRRFSESLSDIGSGFTRFAAWLLGEFPRIVLTLAIIAAAVFVIAFIVRKLRGTPKVRVGRISKRASGKTELPPDGTDN